MLFAIGIIGLTSNCNKSTNFENSVFIVQAVSSQLVGVSVDGGVGTGQLIISAAREVDNNVKIDLSVLDTAFLNKYNAENNRSFYLLSDSAYTISTTSTDIAQGSATSGLISVNINLNNWKSYNPTRQYVVPVKISKVNGAGLVVGQDLALLKLNVIITSSAALIGTTGSYTDGLVIPAHAFTDPATQDVYKQFTIEGRFMFSGIFDGNGAGNVWFNALFSGPGGNIWTIVNSDGNFFGNTSVSAVAAIAPKTWYHLAIVYDNGAGTWYLNGQKVYVGAATVSLGNGTIGHNSSTAKLVYSQWRLWKTARTARQINDFMCVADPGDPDLSAYWPLDATGASGLRDITGNGNTLTASSPAPNISVVNNVKCPD